MHVVLRTDRNPIFKNFMLAQYFSIIHLSRVCVLQHRRPVPSGPCTFTGQWDTQTKPCNLGAYMRVLETNDKYTNICRVYFEVVVRKTKPGKLIDSGGRLWGSVLVWVVGNCLVKCRLEWSEERFFSTILLPGKWHWKPQLFVFLKEWIPSRDRNLYSITAVVYL